MSQPTESKEAGPELLRALSAQYVDHHSNIGNYAPFFFIESWLLRRLGIEPWRWPGRLAGGIIHSLMILLPALILTSLTGRWADAPLFSWTIIAIAWGASAMVGPPLYRSAIGNLLSWLGTIVDEADLRRLLAWDYRWYSVRVLARASGALTLGVVPPLFLVLHHSGVRLPAGTLYIGAFLLGLVAQNACAVVMVPFETYNLSTCKHTLYRLSPADSVPVRRSLRGYNQLGAVNVIVVTLVILLFLLLLPSRSLLVAPLAVSLLLVELAYTALGSLLPRLILGHIVRSRKEEEMAVLQRWLDDLLPRIQELAEDEYKQMKRLKEIQDAIRDSPDNLLPLADIVRTAGALLLSALTVLATAFAQEWIAGLLRRLTP